MRSMTHKTMSVASTSSVAFHAVFSQPQASASDSATISSARVTTRTRKLSKPIARHFPIQRGTTEPERLRRLAEIAVVLGDGFLDGLFFQLFEIQRGDAFRRRRGGGWH